VAESSFNYNEDGKKVRE